MPAGECHHTRNRRYVIVRNFVMKEVAHGVDEDQFGCAPPKRLGQLFRYQGEVKAVLIRVTRHTTETFSKCLCIAVRAARTDLGTTTNWIPGGICPFDF